VDDAVTGETTAFIAALPLAGLVVLAAFATVRRRRRAKSPEQPRGGVEVPVGDWFGQVELDEDGPDPLDPLAAELLPEPVCRHFSMLPISLTAGEVVLAVANPLDSLGLEVARALLSRPIRVVVAAPDQLERAIDRVFNGESETSSPQNPAKTVEPLEAEGEAPDAGRREERLIAEVERRIEEALVRLEVRAQEVETELAAARARAAAEHAEALTSLKVSLDRMMQSERRVLAIEERIGRVEWTIKRTADSVAHAAGVEERLRAASQEEAEAATRIGAAERRLRGLIDS
jgi:hypothetical protein